MLTYKKEPTDLEKEIANLLATMKNMDPASDEYSTVAKNLKVLCEAQSLVKDEKRHISSDTLFTGGVILLQTCLIVFAEEWRPITSRAMSVITRVRV